jgi:hypothetical protein
MLPITNHQLICNKSHACAMSRPMPVLMIISLLASQRTFTLLYAAFASRTCVMKLAY